VGYSNHEVCHLWASGNKDSAKSNHGNVYFDGPKLYSYGSHFMLGYIVAPGVVFLNSDSYSVSTSKHKGYASYAVSHFEQFSLPKLQNFESLLDRIRAHRSAPRKGADLKALRARVESTFAEFLAAYPGRNRDGWAWIFEQAGIKLDRMELVSRKVDADLRRKAADDEREAVATWRADGKGYAAMSGSEFAGTVNAIRYGENGYRAKADLETLSNRLRRAHKQASADGHNRRKAILWGRLGRVRAALREMKDSGVSSYRAPSRLSRVVCAVAILRRLERVLREPKGAQPGPKALEQAAGHVSTLLAGHMPPATRKALEGYRAGLYETATARTLEIERERFEKEAEDRRAWLSGAASYARARLSDERGGALIRARDAELDGCRVIGGELETSHGARVPLNHAARIFAFVRRVREAGQGWQGNPERPLRVGHYQLDRIELNGDFVAGCHRINWNETERLARELGLWDCPATVLADETESA
jgi:hypothetical protein